MDIKDKVAVVTGAAGGIGAALARRLAAGTTHDWLVAIPLANTQLHLYKVRLDRAAEKQG